MPATLILTRHVRLADRSRSWEIAIDGHPSGTIADGETSELTLDAGPHTLQLKRPRGSLSSPPRSFDADPGDTVSFSCHTQTFWPGLLLGTITRNHWIVLKRR